MNISALSKEALHRRKAQGLRVGSIPYGFGLAGDGETLVPNKSEQRGIEIVRRLRAEGWTLEAISKYLAIRGIHNRRGAPFNAKSILAMARRQ
jgi:site-specific DNA recombinase